MAHKTGMFFYARENDPKSIDLHSAIYHNGYHYTPFSGHVKDLAGARDFLRRNGTFWKQRGKTLYLFHKTTRLYYGCSRGTELITNEALNRVA